MSIIHQATLVPTKIELLTDWLPAQHWYQGQDNPHLSLVGGFRLDDPAGEVGVEFMVVRDENDETYYVVPLTYRGAPLPGDHELEHLVGTLEHSVLGKRYVYDGPHDPVWREAVAALLDGEAEPQARTVSDTRDLTVQLMPGTEAGRVGEETVNRVTVPGELEGTGVVIPVDGADGEAVPTLVLRGAAGA
ncbi:MAG: maltokinase N-terminal cap-like domain-containing protein [Galactobacter sp.]